MKNSFWMLMLSPRRRSLASWTCLIVALSVSFFPSPPPSLVDTDNVNDGNGRTTTTFATVTNKITQLDNNSAMMKKKLFVFHIGPYKTGTTTIQSGGKRHQDTTLPEDNYHYIGKGARGKRSPIFNVMSDKQCRHEVNIALETQEEMPACWNDVRNAFQVFSDDYPGKSIFLSTESSTVRTGSRQWWIELKDMLLHDFGYHIVIIVAYRRLYQWIPSAHTQSSRGGTKNGKWRRWLKDGGRDIKTIYPKVMTNLYVNPENATTPNWYGWTPTHLEKIPGDIIETRLFNIHKTTHTLTTFFCDIMPDTPRTCQAVIDAENDPERKIVHANPSTPYWYDFLVLAAEAAGLIDTTKHADERRKVWHAAKDYHRLHYASDLDGFEWICPTYDEHQQILNASLSWERQIIGTSSEEEEEEHIAHFWEYANKKKKFCNLDTDAVLQTNEWKEFFQQYS